MKSIKEKAAEYRRVIKVINEHESIVDTKGSEMFEEGANYVLEQIEGHINRLEYGLNANCMVTAKNACECLRSITEQLKK